MNLTPRQTTIHYQNYPTLPAIPETKLYLSSNAMEALFQDKYYYANNQTFWKKVKHLLAVLLRTVSQSLQQWNLNLTSTGPDQITELPCFTNMLHLQTRYTFNSA